MIGIMVFYYLLAFFILGIILSYKYKGNKTAQEKYQNNLSSIKKIDIITW